MLKRLSGKNEYYFLVHVNHLAGLQPELLDGTDQIKIAWYRGEDKAKSGSTEPITLQRASPTTAIGKLITSGGKFDRSVKSQSGFKSKSFLLKLLQKDQEFWTHEFDMAEFLVSGQRNEVKKELSLSTWTKHSNAKLVIDIRTGPEGDSGENEPFKVELPTVETGRTRTLARGRVVQRASVYNSMVQGGSIGGSLKTDNSSTNIDLLQKQNEMLKEQVQSQRSELVSLRTEIDRLKQERTQGGEDLILKLQKEVDNLNEQLLQKSGYDSDGYDQDKIAELELKLQEKDILQADRDKLQLENGIIQNELAKLKEEIKEIQGKSEYSTGSTIDSLRVETDQLKSKVKILEQERDSTKKELNGAQLAFEKKLRSQKDSLEEESRLKLEDTEKKHKAVVEKIERRIMIEKSNLELQLNTAVNAKQKLEDKVSSLKEVIRSHSQKEREYEQRLLNSQKQIDQGKIIEQENNSKISELLEVKDKLKDDLRNSQQQQELLKTEVQELKNLIEIKDGQIIDLQIKTANNNSKGDIEDVKEHFQRLKDQEQTIQFQKTEIIRLQKQYELQAEQLAERQESITMTKQSLHETESMLQNSEALVVELRSNIDQLNERCATSESHISNLQDEIRELKDCLRRKEQELSNSSQNAQSMASRLEKYEQDRQVLEVKKRELEEKVKEAKREIDSIDLTKGTTDVHLLNKLKKVEMERDQLLLENEQHRSAVQQGNEKLERLQVEKSQLEQRLTETMKTVKMLKQENADYLRSSAKSTENGVDVVDLELMNKLQLKLDRLDAEKDELFQQVENQTKEVIALSQQLKSATATIVKLKHQLSTSPNTEQSISSHNDQAESQLQLMKEENKRLKEKMKLLKARLLLSQEELTVFKKKAQFMEREKKNQESQQIIIELSHKESTKDQDSLTKERMVLDPIGSVKHSALIIITYYESKIEEYNGDLNMICKGPANKELTRLVNLLLCESLVYVFKSGFTPPFWIFTTPHHWHMIEEISALYKTTISPSEQDITAEMLLGAKFASYVKFINTEIIQSSGPHTIEDIKFRAFMVHCVNQQTLHSMIQFLFTHRSILSRFYSPDDAAIMDSGCQRKLVGFLTLLCKLPFSVPLSSVTRIHDHWVEEINL